MDKIIISCSKNHSVRYDADDLLLLWDSAKAQDGIISVPELQKLKFKAIRQEFLTFIYHLGESKIGTRKLREHLSLPCGFSAWWFSSLFERHPAFYRGTLYEIFKLRTLELWLQERRTVHVSVDADIPVAQNIFSLCVEMGIPCEIVPLKVEKISSATVVQCLKATIRNSFCGGLYLRLRELWEWWLRVRSKFPSRPKVRRTEGLLLCTWFPNIDKQAAARGEFRSRYWEGVHDIISETDQPVHWFLIHADPAVSIADNVALRDRFLTYGKQQGDITFSEECLTFGGAVRAYYAWFRIAWKARWLAGNVPKVFTWPNSSLKVFPLLKDMWQDSTCGWHLLLQLIQRESIQNYCALVGRQHKVITSSELQFWERMIFSEQRKLGCSKIYAAQHSTIREADFRFFCDFRSWSIPEFCCLMPDYFLCNGAAALKSMRESGFPEQRLGSIEAARFMHLSGTMPLLEVPTKRLLVVTSYFVEETEAMLRVLGQAMQCSQFPALEEVLIKPHPDVPVGQWVEIFFDVPPSVVEGVVEQYFTQGTMVFVAAGTSVALLALYLGLPTVVMPSENSFDMGSLGDIQGVCYARNEKELLQALRKPSYTSMTKDYFFLDANMLQWKKILAN